MEQETQRKLTRRKALILFGEAAAAAALAACNVPPQSAPAKATAERRLPEAESTGRAEFTWHENDGTPVKEVVNRYDREIVHVDKNGTIVMQYAFDTGRYVKIIEVEDQRDPTDAMQWIYDHCNGTTTAQQAKESGFLMADGVYTMHWIENVSFFPKIRMNLLPANRSFNINHHR